MLSVKNNILFCLLFAAIQFAANVFIFDYPVGRSISQALFSAVFMGLTFHFVFQKFLVWMAQNLEKSLPTLELLPNESMVIEAGANHFKGIEAVGGKLTLTDQRLVFISHKFNIQKNREEFDRSSIFEVKPHHKFSKGIILTTKENASHTFIVDLREKWISELNSTVN